MLFFLNYQSITLSVGISYVAILCNLMISIVSTFLDKIDLNLLIVKLLVKIEFGSGVSLESLI